METDEIRDIWSPKIPFFKFMANTGKEVLAKRKNILSKMTAFIDLSPFFSKNERSLLFTNKFSEFCRAWHRKNTSSVCLVMAIIPQLNTLQMLFGTIQLTYCSHQFTKFILEWVCSNPLRGDVNPLQCSSKWNIGTPRCNYEIRYLHIICLEYDNYSNYRDSKFIVNKK